MGAGKTSVLAEASDILTLRHIAHAAIDLDTLGLALLPDGSATDSAMYKNLRSVRSNYAAMGVERFLLARAVESSSELTTCRKAISATQTVVCRLTASRSVLEQRVRSRETGIRSDEFVARVATLNAILDRVALEDFAVVNEDRRVNDVAIEVLIRAGWLTG
jgi:hypothetical protein